jgi:rubredoxin
MQKDTKIVGASAMPSTNELHIGDAGVSASETVHAATGEWACQFCGYVYDPSVGDPENGIAPGTPWEDIPGDWCCPMCSAEKDGFAKL